MKKLFIITLCSLFVFMACDTAVIDQEVGGTLALNIEGGSRLVDTNKDLFVDKYSIVITRVDSGKEVLNRTVELWDSLKFGPYEFGKYSVDVKALNVAGEVIYDTKTPVEVEVITARTATANVTISPKAGTGDLEIDVLWTAADLSGDAVVTASLTPLNQPKVDLTVAEVTASVATDKKVTVNQTGLSTGYQTLVVELRDNGELARGVVELVRIADLAKSGKATYDFRSTADNPGVNRQNGNLDIKIETEFKNTIKFKNVSSITSLTPGQTVDLSAQVVTDEELIATDNVVYVWYYGSKVVSGPTTAKASEVLTGSFTAPEQKHVDNITLIVYKADGSRAGDSIMKDVRVVESATGGNTGV